MPTTHDTDVREAWTVRLVWHDKTTGEWLPVFRFNLFETVVDKYVLQARTVNPTFLRQDDLIGIISNTLR